MRKITKVRQLKELSKELGITLPVVSEKLDSKSMREQSNRLIRYAQEHGVVITPVGYGYFVESYIQFSRCPCDSARKNCPCEQALEEIKVEGKCLCHLFWRDYQTFLDFRSRSKGVK